MPAEASSPRDELTDRANRRRAGKGGGALVDLFFSSVAEKESRSWVVGGARSDGLQRGRGDLTARGGDLAPGEPPAWLGLAWFGVLDGLDEQGQIQNEAGTLVLWTGVERAGDLKEIGRASCRERVSR